VDERIDDSGGMLGFQILKILIQNEMLERFVATNRQQNTGHFHIDTVIADIECRETTNSVDTRFKNMTASVTQYVVAQI
jgi:hypothetical protein